MWQKAIQDFDADLKTRMKEITEHERTYSDMDNLLEMRINSWLGFPDRGIFPWWRNKEKEWHIRNSDWLKQYSSCYRDKNKKKLSNQKKDWYLKNRESVIKRVMENDRLNKDNRNEYRKLWKRKKRVLIKQQNNIEKSS